LAAELENDLEKKEDTDDEPTKGKDTPSIKNNAPNSPPSSPSSPLPVSGEPGTPDKKAKKRKRGKVDDKKDSPPAQPMNKKFKALTKALQSKFTESQKTRFDRYIHSKFPKKDIRRIIQQISATNKMPTAFPVVMASLCKLYVGQLVEESRLVMQQWGEIGKIRPVHLREAARRLKVNENSKPILRRRF